MGPPSSDAKSVRLPSSQVLGAVRGAVRGAVMPTVSAGIGTGWCTNGNIGSNGNLLADVIDFADRIASM